MPSETISVHRIMGDFDVLHPLYGYRKRSYPVNLAFNWKCWKCCRHFMVEIRPIVELHADSVVTAGNGEGWLK